jgi:hypothetical protein
VNNWCRVSSSKVLPAGGFAGACEQVNALAAKPRTTLEVLKLYFSKAPGMPPDTASDYAGTLLGLPMQRFNARHPRREPDA